MKKLFIAVLAISAVGVLCSCSDDSDDNNQPYQPTTAVPTELRAIHYNYTTGAICGFNVYKLKPKTVSDDSQKAYEVRKYTANYDGNPTWDLDFLADNNLEYCPEDGDYYQSEFYRRIGKDYNVSKSVTTMPKARYNSRGLVESIGEYSKTVPNAWQVSYTYNSDGRLIQSFDHCNLTTGGTTAVETEILSTFEWNDGNLTTVTRTEKSVNSGMVRSLTSYRLTYTQSPDRQPSLFCLIFDDLFSERLIRIADYDDLFANRYGLMSKDLLTAISVDCFDRVYPDPNDPTHFDYVINQDCSYTLTLTPKFDTQGTLTHYDLTKHTATSATSPILYSYDIKY